MSIVNSSFVDFSDSAYDIFWSFVNVTYSYGEAISLYSADLPSIFNWDTSVLGELSALSTAGGAACVIALRGIWTICKKLSHSKKEEDALWKRKMLQLIKKSHLPGCSIAVMKEMNRLNLDVNQTVSPTGLTFFLFGCLVGDAQLIKYMIDTGADVKVRTVEGDTALYLATYAILHSAQPDTSALRVLIEAGCGVNEQNKRGYTPLHRAASRGNVTVIQFLLKEGADPYIANHAGVYPIDSAVCAGHMDAASLLKLKFPNPHVWDVVDPHTPPHIRMGFQSPQRKALCTSRPLRPLRNVFT